MVMATKKIEVKKRTNVAKGRPNESTKKGKAGKKAAERRGTTRAPVEPTSLELEATGTRSAELAAAARAVRDPRLPAAGTVLRKVDRHGNVRCECRVDEIGVQYKGTRYRSLSAAAVAAAKDLDIKGAQNGYIFWGLIRPARSGGQDPLLRLQRSWERYAICARMVLAAAAADQKPGLIAAIERHHEVPLVPNGLGTL
jgi:hypothetical protein